MAKVEEVIALSMVLNIQEMLKSLDDISQRSLEYKQILDRIIDTTQQLATLSGMSFGEIASELRSYTEAGRTLNSVLADLNIMQAEARQLQGEEVRQGGLANRRSQEIENRAQMSEMQAMALKDAENLELSTQRRLALETKENDVIKRQYQEWNNIIAANATRLEQEIKANKFGVDTGMNFGPFQTPK